MSKYVNGLFIWFIHTWVKEGAGSGFSNAFRKLKKIHIFVSANAVGNFRKKIIIINI